MIGPSRRCSECDGLLWSDEAKLRGVHPECVDEIYEAVQGKDLEDALEIVLEEAQS